MVQIQQPNLLGALTQGFEARARQEDMQARAGLRSAVGEFGPASPEAMNALGRADPAAAMTLAAGRSNALEERRRMAAQGLVSSVLEAPEAERPRAWAAALETAGGMGLDLSGVPAEYPGEVGLRAMRGLLGMSAAERTEFERMVEGLPPEQRRQAVMVKLGLAPQAEAEGRPTFRPATPDEAAAYGAAAGQIDTETGRFYPSPAAPAAPADPLAALKARAAEAGLRPGSEEYRRFMLEGGRAAGISLEVGPEGGVSFRTGGSAAGPNTDEFTTRTGRIMADEAAAIAQAGAQAQANLRSIDRLESLLQSAPSGAAGAVQQWLGEFGIETEGLSDIQAAQALINKLVPEQRQPGSGPMSDADLALFRASMPRIINTPGGNRQIVETLRAIASYDVQRGQIARRLQLMEITPRQAAEAWDALSNPLADFAAGERGPGTPIGGFDPEFLQTLTDEDREALEYLTPEERALFR